MLCHTVQALAFFAALVGAAQLMDFHPGAALVKIIPCLLHYFRLSSKGIFSLLGCTPSLPRPLPYRSFLCFR